MMKSLRLAAVRRTALRQSAVLRTAAKRGFFSTGFAEFRQQSESGLLDLRRRLDLKEARLGAPGLVTAQGVLVLGGDIAGVVVRHADHHRRLEWAFALDVQA